ncbi:MAG: hypothetical protein ABI680_13585, partial [Chthoniobacteraceae bacterium]
AIAAVIPQFLAVTLPILAVVVAPCLAVLAGVVEVVPALILVLLEIVACLLAVVGALTPRIVAIVHALIPLLVATLGTLAPIRALFRANWAFSGTRPVSDARTLRRELPGGGTISKRAAKGAADRGTPGCATGDSEEISDVTLAGALAGFCTRGGAVGGQLRWLPRITRESSTGLRGKLGRAIGAAATGTIGRTTSSE